MAVKLNQVYAELGAKKRYLMVDEIDGEEAVCLAGWKGRSGIAWSHRRPVILLSELEDTTKFRLEQDA
jgi:hypothetical protein